MHNENIHDRHPEAKKIIHWLERERANDFGQFLNPFKKSFKMNSMAQANTDCCLEVSLELGLCEAPMLMVSWPFWVMPLSDQIKPPNFFFIDLNSERPWFSLSMMGSYL